MIGIINCGTGNLLSVSKAFEHIAPEKKTVILNRPDQLPDTTHIVLPGAGNFHSAMDSLNRLKFIPALEKEVFENKKPFLGICLGMQLLCEYGLEQKKTKGLGWIKGVARKLDSNGMRLPHIGWQEIEVEKDCMLLKQNDDADYYFVHNFIVDCPKEHITSFCRYSEKFAASIQLDNIHATQFHPEKSRKAGLKILKNFIGGGNCSNTESFLSCFCKMDD